MTPELLGVPVAGRARGAALFSFMLALGALSWQVAEPFLDSGRVKVYLSTFLRGYVALAGQTKRPQHSSRRLRWRIARGAYRH